MQDFQEIIGRIFRIVRHASFPNILEMFDFQYFEIPKNDIVQAWFAFFLDLFVVGRWTQS